MNTPNQKEKTKILYVVTKGSWGGAQRYVFDLATSLPRDKFDVAVAFGEGEILEKKLKERNIRTIYLQNSQRDIGILKDIKLFFEILTLLKKEKPDIVHLNSSKIGLIGALATRLVNVKRIVFTAHGWAFNDSKFFLQKTILKFAQWLTVLWVHRTIAVSQKTKNDIAYLPLIQSKVEVIYNGISNIEFLPKKKARESLLTESKEVFWVGTVAELHQNKGVDVLLEAFELIVEEHSEVKLVVIGGGEEMNLLEKKIKEKGLEDNVLLKGFIENAQSYLKAFDIFVIPSRTEGLPYSLLEAGLSGNAVVGSKVGGIPEVIEDNLTGLLIGKDSSKELKDKILELVKETKRRELLGENLKRKVEEEFTLDKMVTETLLVYDVKYGRGKS